MPASIPKQKIEDKLFAQKLLEHGMNAKEAMQDMKPHLTEHSAEVSASRMLKRVENSGAMDSLTAGARELWTSIAKESIAQLHKQAQDDSNPMLQLNAHKLLIEYGKILAPANTMPKNLTQINKYALPKRS